MNLNTSPSCPTRSGLSWLCFGSQVGLGACLDDMGLGKTLPLFSL